MCSYTESVFEVGDVQNFSLIETPVYLTIL